ncbi:ABC transporter permease subunit [Liquorilactobacillus satsumensis]|uniref:ABC transporter permease subunit n=1 Tax=Liquorilactobacillus satsumensis TaxID=259059 RepID=UPI001E40AEA3|nr:ABC transporter permease subunit [Liquorilactobacillus satsumensis]MCC7667752.1 phosphonate ABC transporter permease [Liquorilactobacillus satsumensis]MCP9356917.1 ABC transporter permease subunit [Liquorilactobacillus satsumensis]MCP9370864.1 ABC transporter permease subunit [Liquorilactobacillus satsumensis]
MKTKKQSISQFFKNKHLKKVTIVGILALFYLMAAFFLDYDLSSLSTLSDGWTWLFKYFIPDHQSTAILATIISQIFKTFLIAVAATSCAAFLALILAILGVKSAGLPVIFGILIKGFASILRNIPLTAWALILVFSFKQNNFTGFLTLLFMALGFLTRAFIETIEDYGSEKITALQVTGASYPQIVFQAMLPELTTPLLEWVLYMLENNIRDAVLVGLLTGSGVGFLFDLYFKSLRYHAAGLVILGIIVLVITWELLSIQIKRWIEK